MRIVFVSTSVGPLGFGVGGGVELTLRTLASGLRRLGHSVTVVAPRGSVLGLPASDADVQMVQVDGALHVPSQTLDRATELVVPADSVLLNMWKKTISLATDGDCDVVLNFAYDAHPFVHAQECAVPVAHLVSMGSLSDEMDRAVRCALQSRPLSIAMHSRAQAATFGADIAAAATIVGGGVETNQYDFVATPGTDLAFVARISPEKGIADAFEVAARSGRRLLVFGVMEDAAAWRDAAARFPHAQVEHVGFLATHDLAVRLGKCAALIMVHRWVEAFGNVAIEALACGVPVITYDRGGPAEIVRDGVTGFVVPVDQPALVAAALGQLGVLDRRNCRIDAVERFSAAAFARRVEIWLTRQMA